MAASEVRLLGHPRMVLYIRRRIQCATPKFPRLSAAKNSAMAIIEEDGQFQRSVTISTSSVSRPLMAVG